MIDSLQQISDLVSQVTKHQAEVLVMENNIKEAKEKIRELLEISIPDAMAEVGMSDVGLVDGTRVTVKPFHYGSITMNNREAAHTWLENHGFGGLIKRDVVLSFGKDDYGVDGLRAYVREMGLSSKEKESVHPMTLSAFIREQAEKGEPVPQELFSVYSGLTTKLSR